MIKGLIYLIILVLVISIFKLPWLASAVYMATSILQPQAIWPWGVGTIPIFKIAAGFALIGFAIMVARKEVDWSVYKYKQNYAVFIIWVLVNLSSTFTFFPNYVASVSSEILIGTLNIIVLMYFVLLGTLNHERGIKYLAILFMAVVFYYVYWANDIYFTSQWQHFKNNRLTGPDNTPYADGNSFAVLLVIGMPFFLFGIFYVKSKFAKICLAAFIPLLWHAVLLTSSRGALLALGVLTLICAFMIRSKSFNIVIMCGFLAFILTQGQTVIDRSYETLVYARSAEVANPRLISWGIGVELALKHPFLGVGPERFLTASDYYFPGKSPHVAHNTILSVAANIGIPAMLLFISLLIAPWKRFVANKALLKSIENTDTNDDTKQSIHFYEYIKNASLLGIMGFSITCLFLDMMIFEPFYLVLLLNLLANHQLQLLLAQNKVTSEQPSLTPMGYRYASK